MELAVRELVINLTLFAMSSEMDKQKDEYSAHLQERPKEENYKSMKMPQPGFCFPLPLQIFSTTRMTSLFPDLYLLVKIISPLPVAVASFERTRNKVKIINTYLTPSISDDRLENVTEISIENIIAQKTEFEGANRTLFIFNLPLFNSYIVQLSTLFCTRKLVSSFKTS